MNTAKVDFNHGVKVLIGDAQKPEQADRAIEQLLGLKKTEEKLEFLEKTFNITVGASCTMPGQSQKDVLENQYQAALLTLTRRNR